MYEHILRLDMQMERSYISISNSLYLYIKYSCILELYRFRNKGADSDKHFSGRFSISTDPIQMRTDPEFGCFDPTCLLFCDIQKTRFLCILYIHIVYILFMCIYIYCYAHSGVYDNILMYAESRVWYMSEHTRNSSKICVQSFL